MFAFLFFILGLFVAGILLRSSPPTWRLALAFLAAIALTFLYFTLQRFI